MTVWKVPSRPCQTIPNHPMLNISTKKCNVYLLNIQKCDETNKQLILNIWQALKIMNQCTWLNHRKEFLQRHWYSFNYNWQYDGFFFYKKTCWGKLCKVIRQGKSLVLAHCPPSLRSCCKVWKRFPFLYFVACRLYAVVTKDKTWDASADIVSVLRQTTS